MLLHTSSSLLRASGYFFPVGYWGATFEMQPGWAPWDRDVTAWLAPVPAAHRGRASQFLTLSWVQSIIQPFFFFLSSAGRGTGRDKLDFSLIWNPEWLTTLPQPRLIWKPNWFLECTRLAWASPLWPNVNSPRTGGTGELDYGLLDFNSEDSCETYFFCCIKQGVAIGP